MPDPLSSAPANDRVGSACTRSQLPPTLRGFRVRSLRHDRVDSYSCSKLHVSPPSLQFPLAGPALIVFQRIAISHLALTTGNWLRAGELLPSVEIGGWLHLLASSELGSRLQPPVPAGIPAPALFWARASTDPFTYGAYRFSRSRPRENELASEFALTVCDIQSSAQMELSRSNRILRTSQTYV